MIDRTVKNPFFRYPLILCNLAVTAADRGTASDRITIK
jgi:hypothetical protein